MNIPAILIAAGMVGGVGIIIGALLGVASEAFRVEKDEKEEKVRACLPGNNCGGCGFPGCDGLAAAIAKGEAPVSACPVGGAPVAEQIAQIMGVVACVEEKKVAFVRCAGTCDKTKVRYEYYGNMDCNQLGVVPGAGDKGCQYGCLGYGSCVKACKFDAIHVVDGVAVVDREKCTACGACAAACPKGLIELIPYETWHMVQCSSHEKGKDVKEVCSVGCIGCGMCQRVCEHGAITLTDNLAHIDYLKCVNCGKCAEKCPVKVIRSDKVVEDDTLVAYPTLAQMVESAEHVTR